MKRVAAPSAPEASMPDVGELPPSGGGFARVVIGTDVPARIERITHRVVYGKLEEGSYSLSAGEGLLCVETPCTSPCRTGTTSSSSAALTTASA